MVCCYNATAKNEIFFIGATPELMDIRYLASPSTELSFLDESPEDKINGILNKFGFKTETTGRLILRLNNITIGE